MKKGHFKLVKSRFGLISKPPFMITKGLNSAAEKQAATNH